MIAALVSDENWWVTGKRIDVRKGVKEHQRYRMTHQEEALICVLLDNVEGRR
jgi:hypothetical protein